jgi:hypothetical protein
MVHLRLLRGSRANQRQLYSARRIFKHGQTLRHRAERGTARLPKFQSALHVSIHEHTLDCNFPGLMLLDESLQTLKNEAEALSHLSTSNIQASVGHMYVVGAATFDNTETRTP